MRLSFVLLPLIACSGAALAAADSVQHHNLTFGIGPAIPTGNSTAYLGTAPLIAFRYGYRFNRYFQADAGLQLGFGAAGGQNPVVTDIGTVQGGDREYMVPLGGRVYLPLPFHRVQVSAGGGAAWLHYTEVAPSGGYYQVSCYSCTSRGGWGGYGLGNVSYFLDENHNFRFGTTVQYINARTTGDAVGNVPALSTRDHWVNLMFEFGLSF